MLKVRARFSLALLDIHYFSRQQAFWKFFIFFGMSDPRTLSRELSTSGQQGVLGCAVPSAAAAASLMSAALC